MFEYYRLNQIFSYIYKHPHTSNSTLAKKFEISDRTIRTDINNINHTLKEYGITVKSKRNQGYFIEATDPKQMTNIMKSLEKKPTSIDITNYQDRLTFIIYRLLNTDRYINLQQLADEIFISKSTIQNYLKTIKKILSKYQLECITKVNEGIRVIGEEGSIRYCFIHQVLHTNKLFDWENDYKTVKTILSKQLNTNNIVCNDNAFNNLTLGVLVMVERIKSNHYLTTNTNILSSVKLNNIVNLISSDLSHIFGIEISAMEKQHLSAYLIANTNLNTEKIITTNLTTLINDVLDYIYHEYRFDLRNDEILKHDLLIHIHSLLTSHSVDIYKKNPLLHAIKSQFSLSFEITLISFNKIFTINQFNEDEIGYIALHIGAALERYFNERINSVNVILLCGAGNAVARIMEARLFSYFKEKINVKKVITYNGFLNDSTEQLSDIDLIISTEHLPTVSIPTVKVDFPLNNHNVEAISKMLNKLNENKKFNLRHFFDPDLFIYTNESITKEFVLKKLSQLLVKKGIVNDSYFPSLVEREKLSKTNMNKIFAIPHAMISIARETKVAVAISQKPIMWNRNNETVQIVFMFATKANETKDMEALYDLFIQIVNDTKLQKLILASRTYDEFIHTINLQTH